MQMMNRVVDEVPPERLDGEIHAVTAPAGALPLAGGDGVEVRCDDLRRTGQLPRYRAGVLLAVAVLDRRGVLIPVGELRPVSGEHQGEPLLVQPQNITNVAAVLQGRPLRR